MQCNLLCFFLSYRFITRKKIFTFIFLESNKKASILFPWIIYFLVSYFGLFDGGTCHALITIIAYYGKICLYLIIFTITALFAKLIINCKNINDNYGKLLIIGFSSIILLQSLVNILGNLNLIPLMDINLPFISYGFNGLLVNMVTMAFLLSIYRRKDILYKMDDTNKKIKIKIYFE